MRWLSIFKKRREKTKKKYTSWKDYVKDHEQEVKKLMDIGCIKLYDIEYADKWDDHNIIESKINDYNNDEKYRNLYKH